MVLRPATGDRVKQFRLPGAGLRAGRGAADKPPVPARRPRLVLVRRHCRHSAAAHRYRPARGNLPAPPTPGCDQQRTNCVNWSGVLRTLQAGPPRGIPLNAARAIFEFRGIPLNGVETEAALQRFARAGPGPGRAVAGRSGLGGVAGAWLLRLVAAAACWWRGCRDSGRAVGSGTRQGCVVQPARWSIGPHRTGSMEHRAGWLIAAGAARPRPAGAPARGGAPVPGGAPPAGKPPSSGLRG